ncbi:MAG: MBL fold metallo-hydrolase [Methanomassiliicoccales archaeon]|jgi:glyoxylase-like metal-dependent hydrolase (beta-lactamase superfamily II)
MSDNIVELLCSGSIRKEGNVVIEAHSSSSLIRSDTWNIVVDTSSLEHRDTLLAALDRIGLDRFDVDLIVNTHLHHDHCSNNGLFPNATLMAHSKEGPGGGYRKIDRDLEICPGVRLVHTPGHTRGSMSVFVEAGLRYAIAGDAFPTQENYLRWVPPGLNCNPDLALASMREIVAFADIVVPGHDAPFRVDR